METSVKSFFGGNLVPLITGLDGRKCLLGLLNKLDARTETGFLSGVHTSGDEIGQATPSQKIGRVFCQISCFQNTGTDFSSARIIVSASSSFFSIWATLSNPMRGWVGERSERVDDWLNQYFACASKFFVKIVYP